MTKPHTIIKDIKAALTIMAGFLLLTLYSCANISTPSGGPRDEDAPRFINSNPLPYTTEFDGNRIQLEFDELVNVKDVFSKVTVSPPQRQMPKISSLGRRIIVQFNDTLAPNTTYNIDFGNAIEDVNEANKIPAFSFTFSTGEEIDTLMMSGVVLDAQTLEPQQGVLVGAYTNLVDTAFLTLPFERVTRTDDRGRFVLRGLKAEPYNLFALADLNNDFHWDNPAELMAFLPYPVTPYTEQVVATDTIFNMLTGQPDSIVKRDRTRFLPNNLLLQMFDFGFKQQYITNHARTDSTRLDILFNQRQESAPELTLVSPIATELPEQWYITERNERNDSIYYWLSPQLFGVDTLKVSLQYAVEQRGKEPKINTDTLTFITKHPKPVKPRKLTAKQMQEDSIRKELDKFLLPAALGSSPMDVYRTMIVQFTEPLLQLNNEAIHIDRLNEDSVWVSVPFTLNTDSLIPRRLRMEVPWDFDTEYRLTVDSLAAQGISGKMSRTLEKKFKTKREDDYAMLIMRLSPGNIPGFVEVLNSSDAVVQRAPVVNGVATFKYLTPNDYYVRFIADANGNGRYDPGDYERGIQPDETYYYPKVISLKRFDRNEEWDLNATPVDMQKPDKIKKNKPEDLKRGRKSGSTTEENEEDDYFDVNRNPFDPNDKGRKRTTMGSY